jgi:transcriptional regulator GlxA family with amidase domain
VKNAKTLLANTNLSIEQVALQVGFSNRYGLIRAFRAIEGMTPSEYRSLIDAGH